MLPNLSRLSLLAQPTDEFVILEKDEEDTFLNDLVAGIDPKDEVPEGEDDNVVFDAVVGVDSKNKKQIKQKFLARDLWAWLIHSLDTKNPGTAPTKVLMQWDDWVLLRDRFGPKETVYLPHVLKLEMLFRDHWKKGWKLEGGIWKPEPLPTWLEGVSQNKRRRASDSDEPPSVMRQRAFTEDDLLAASVETPESRFQSIKEDNPDLVITILAQNAEQLLMWYDRMTSFFFAHQQLHQLRAIIAEDPALKAALEQPLYRNYTVEKMHDELLRYGYELKRVRQRYLAGRSTLAPTRRET